MSSYCRNLKRNNNSGDVIITPSNKYKWFFPFRVTLLNNMSFKIMNDRDEQKYEEFFNINKDTDVNIFLNDLLDEMEIEEDLYNYFIKNNLTNYFLFPFYLKYLGFSCLSFELCNDKFYGGLYNYLYTNKTGKDVKLIINQKNMFNSRGLKYDQRKDYHPDYLLFNIWDEKDNLIDDITEFAVEYNEFNGKEYADDFNKQLGENYPPDSIHYNKYNYKLKSFLLTNNNYEELKKPQHTITITNCENDDWYGFTNSFINPNPINKAFIKSLFKAQKEEFIPCTKLIPLNSSNLKKTIILPNNKCELKNKEKDDKKNNDNYTFSTRKSKRVLIYIKADKYISPAEEKAKKEAEEKEKKEAEEAAKGNKGKKPEKQETPEQKAKREQDENLCTTIIDYLGKIKTNQNKDKLIEELAAKKIEILGDLDKLKAEQGKYDEERKKLELIKKEIEETQKKNKDELDKMIKDLKDTGPKKNELEKINKDLQESMKQFKDFQRTYFDDIQKKKDKYEPKYDDIYDKQKKILDTMQEIYVKHLEEKKSPRKSIKYV
jgi:hypothetical protein